MPRKSLATTDTLSQNEIESCAPFSQIDIDMESENKELPQNDSDESKAASPQSNGISQTDTGILDLAAEKPTFQPDGGLEQPNSQIDLGDADSSADDASISQNDIKFNTHPTEDEDLQPISQIDSDGAEMTADESSLQSEKASFSQNGLESAPRPIRRRHQEPAIVSIDEKRTVETHQDKHKTDLLDLVESRKSRKILSGTIQGVERSPDNPNLSFAVIYHGDFKIIIPSDETVQPPDDFRGRSPADVMHYLVTKRLGAEIDYIVKGIDTDSGVAAASRLEAMAQKRREYYFGTDRNGHNLLYEGITAEARVVSVIRAGIFVDLFGVETYIPLREVSYQRWIDATAHYQSGQRVLVKILSIDRSDRDHIRVSASVKQAGENPYEKALRRYVPGSRYVGTVSVVDTNGVFVNLDGGVDCLCSYPKRGRPPRGARVTVRIIGVNRETNRIWGAITHMTTAR